MFPSIYTHTLKQIKKNKGKSLVFNSITSALFEPHVIIKVDKTCLCIKCNVTLELCKNHIIV